MGIFSSSPLQKLSASELKSALGDKHVLIIGGTAGIGRALALTLLKQGTRVSIVGRRKPDSALFEVGGDKLAFVQKDLSLMRNAESLAQDVDLAAIDIIVFTNGIFAAPKRQATTEGLELDMAVSYLSRMAFLRKIKQVNKGFGQKRTDKSSKPRIFVMGFPGKFNTATLGDLNAEKEPYKALPVHMNTVVGNEALISYASSLFPDAQVFGLNPGLIQTEIRDNFFGKDSWLSWFAESVIGLIFQSAQQYADDVLVHLLADKSLDSAESNEIIFESNGARLEPNKWLTESDHKERVLKESEELVDRALKTNI